MEFAPQYRKKTCGGCCCVKSCNSTKWKNDTLSFHKIPKRGSAQVTRLNLFGKTEYVDRRSEWLTRLNIVDSNKELLVCSLHFTPNDYYFPDVHAKKRILKKNAVPTPVNFSSKKQAANLQRLDRIVCHKRELNHKSTNKSVDGFSQNTLLQEHVALSETTKTTECDSDSIWESNMATQELLQVKSEESDSCEVELECHDSDCNGNESKTIKCEFEIPDDKNDLEFGKINVDSIVQTQNSADNVYIDKGIQMPGDDLSISFSSFIKSEQDLMTMCNIKNFKILDTLTELMDEIYPQKNECLLSTRDCIILTTAKLKLDIPLSALGVMFKQVCEVTIRNIFFDTVKKLSTILQSVISRVSKDEIMRNMPKFFDKFGATTSVLDCTEIKIQQPKCLKSRVEFYSHCKEDFTVKFMTEFTPAGLIVCVSESFGGSASDKTIFNHTGILQHLESTRDAVMVDKGFSIDDECIQKRIQLIRPHFIKNEKLTEAEALENREIACARVHIKEVNQRIKEFQILNNDFPWSMINYVDDIFLICCGLINLGTPILADDEF